MCLEPFTKFQRNPTTRFRDTEKWTHLHVRTCARADAPHHDLCKMYRDLVPKHTPNLITIGPTKYS